MEKIHDYDESSDKKYILEVDVKYLKKSHESHRDLPFLPERMKIKKCKKLVSNMYNKKSFVVHIKDLKKSLSHALVLKIVNWVTKFN